MLANTLSSREQLEIVLKNIAPESILTDPAVRDVLEQMDADDKIVVALKMARHIVDSNTSPTAYHSLPDVLLTLIATQFDEKSAKGDECRLVFDNPAALGLHLETLDEDELRRIAEGVVPVAILRSLIYHHGIKVKNTTPWCWFVDKWGPLLVERIRRA